MQVWASPTAWKPSDARPAVVVDEAAEAVEQAAHRPHAADRLERPVREELVRAGQHPAGAVEAVGVDSARRSSRVGGADGEGDRQRVAVAGHAEVLHEAEVAAELRVEVGVERRGQPVPAREVHQAALADGLGDRRRRARPATPASGRARPLAATTTSASTVVPSSSRTPVTIGSRRPGRRRRRGRSTPTPGAHRRRPARPARPGAAPTRRWCAARSSTARSSSPGSGSPRLAVVGIVMPPAASRASSTSGKRSRSTTTRRARKPWVWWTCGAPRARRRRPPRVGVGGQRVPFEQRHPVAGAAEGQGTWRARRRRRRSPPHVVADPRDPRIALDNAVAKDPTIW